MSAERLSFQSSSASLTFRTCCPWSASSKLDHPRICGSTAQAPPTKGDKAKGVSKVTP